MKSEPTINKTRLMPCLRHGIPPSPHCRASRSRAGGKNLFPQTLFLFASLLELRNEIFWRGYQSFSYFSTSSSSNWINSKKYFLYNSFLSSPLQISLISLLSISALIFSNFCFLTLLTIARLCSSV